ncbi:MAG: carboxypeptidase-like regulatory domain-containing protein [Bryobacteraceae bacterium]|nr:carboxypeptidase-like regulatory domain-containing protein [Bryobacteraceae bacterium]
MRNHLQSVAITLIALTLRASLPAQDVPAAALSITILEGDNAIVNTRQRLSREAIVQVEDENRKPVAGAAVTFFAPNNGASAVFSNGGNNITVLTDSQGRAAVRGLKPNQTPGKFEIKVTATKEGFRAASTVLSQTNAAAAAAAISGAMLGVIIAGAAAAAVGIAVGVSGGGGSTPSGGGGGAGPRPTVLTPGTITVGPPR